MRQENFNFRYHILMHRARVYTASCMCAVHRRIAIHISHFFVLALSSTIICRIQGDLLLAMRSIDREENNSAKYISCANISSQAT